ncbi:MAG: thioesterase [Deltaproteobacteria bacterium]|nr:thioesterase [Deltaproteobacteria bacterium]
MNPWILKKTIPVSNPQYRLFCFPYAGGQAAIYRSWIQSFPETIEVCAIELPGRGRRFGEPLFEKMSDLIPQIAKVLEEFQDLPFFFFGHSMGSLLAFEMCRFLRAHQKKLPKTLMVSGCGAPQLQSLRNRVLHDLPDEHFFSELERLQGTPAQVLAHPELMKLFLPIIRADLKMVETYSYQTEAPLEIPIIALGGDRDLEVSLSALSAWREQSSHPFEEKIFNGDHFFVKSCEEEVMAFVREKLNQFI